MYETTYDKIIFGSIGVFLVGIASFTTYIIIIASIDSIFGFTCLNKYSNSTYSFLGGCKVEYKGEFIPKELYEKAYTTNANLSITTNN